MNHFEILKNQNYKKYVAKMSGFKKFKDLTDASSRLYTDVFNEYVYLYVRCMFLEFLLSKYKLKSLNKNFLNWLKNGKIDSQTKKNLDFFLDFFRKKNIATGYALAVVLKKMEFIDKN